MVEVSTMKLKHIGGMVNIFTLPFVHVDDKRAYIFSIFSVLVRILESNTHVIIYIYITSI